MASCVSACMRRPCYHNIFFQFETIFWIEASNKVEEVTMRAQLFPFRFVLLILAFAINLNAEPAVERPNIILILTDDLDARMIEYMPNLKALLIDQGTSFDNFFVNVPNCCPSRSSIFRGQFAHNTGITSNTAPNGGFQKFKNTGLEKYTIATWLQNGGYLTAFIGQYLTQYPSRRRS